MGVTGIAPQTASNREAADMTKTESPIYPAHCFCAIPPEELKPWIIKRYAEQRSTVELLNSTRDEREREIITIVSMLDLDDDTVLELMRGVEETADHILACRLTVKAMWRDLCHDGAG